MAFGEATRPPANRGLLRSTLDLAQTQLLCQMADENSLDGRTMGLLAFNAALLAADLAARELLGRFWFVPLFPIGIATGVAAISVSSKEPIFGPVALRFYTDFRSYPADDAQETLLADLAKAYGKNAKRVQGKKTRLRAALLILILGLLASVPIVVFNLPTTAKRCLPTKPACHSEKSKKTAQTHPATGNGELIKLAEALEPGRHGPLVEVADLVEGGSD
jgi:hypothetical protein